MTTLEDKILGEKKHYYCDSSDEDEQEKEQAEGTVESSRREPGTLTKETSTIRDCTSEPRDWDGYSVNTGPKGVLKDWQRYKQLQTEKREQNEAEKRELIKKLSLTCRSNLDEERDKEEELNKEIEGILDDDFLKEYVQKRMEEMIISSQHLPKFGRVISLENGDSFLEAIDKENKQVTVIIHLYEDDVIGCAAMNGCLQCLAREYPQVKFCKLKSSVAGLTNRFKVSGVPALLVYKGGMLVGNFVRMTDEFGEDFFADNVESFLIENGMLPDKTLVPELIRQSQSLDDDGGSDFEVD